MINTLIFGDPSIVPVVMFHSVGAEELDWEFSYISEPVACFESKIRALKESGFSFITWTELHAYMGGDLKLDLPAILLTFDDGYLDNWVHVYPILKKYAAKGTIFVTSDFVDPSDDCRMTMEDVATGRCREDDLEIAGFLNWSEMRSMEESGVIDIQSHAKTHTWYFTGEKPVDFWAPGLTRYPWMAWNAMPEKKPFYLRESQEGYVKYGTPIYEYGKSLAVKRFFPAKEIAEQVTGYVEQQGGAEFFLRQDCREQLVQKHNEIYQAYKDDCRFENDNERRERTVIELQESKTILEENLGKTVDFICWPGGGNDALTLDVAREAGYKAWTLGSTDMSNFRNIPGVTTEYVKRIGSSIHQSWRGKRMGYTSGTEFLYGVRRHQGSAYHKWAGRLLKLGRIVRSPA